MSLNGSQAHDITQRFVFNFLKRGFFEAAVQFVDFVAVASTEAFALTDASVTPFWNSCRTISTNTKGKNFEFKTLVWLEFLNYLKKFIP